MRYVNGLNQTIATELSDLKYGEYRCTECSKVMDKEEVIPNDKGQRLSVNGINFCSYRCRTDNRNAYDRILR